MTTKEFLAMHRALTAMNPDNPPMSIEEFCRIKGLFSVRGNGRQRRAAIRSLIHKTDPDELALILDPASKRAIHFMPKIPWIKWRDIKIPHAEWAR